LTESANAEILQRAPNDDVISLGSLAVGIFFFTSGFLITASAERSTLFGFAWKRFLRLVPALAFVVLITTFILGPALTADANYFSTFETYKYLLNILFKFSPYLPGVFLDNPYPRAVNGSLWTLFFEASCYFVMFLAMTFGLLKYRYFFTILVTFAMAAPILISTEYRLTLIFCDLYTFFGVGTLAYLFRRYVPVSSYIFLLASIAAILCIFYFDARPVLVISLGYCVIMLAYSENKLHLPGDYSYGIYVWAFPIQQIVSQLNPGISWIGNIMLALPPTLAISAVSWHFIERPVMRLKNFGPAGIRKPTRI
jgi:peptidoglycan/LPS O-acetylase OafA/YrhL